MKLTSRILLFCILAFATFVTLANAQVSNIPSASVLSNNDIRLLKNRFRIDGTVEQAAFIIYRDRPKQAESMIS